MRDISIVSCLWKFNDKPTLSKFMWKLKFLCIAKVCEDCICGHVSWHNGLELVSQVAQILALCERGMLKLSVFNISERMLQ